MQPDHTNEKIFRLLKATTALTSALTGGIYLQTRPDDSQKEDIVINCLTYQHGNPATAVSNVNLYVPYKEARIQGKQMRVPNTARVKTLVGLILAALKATSITNCLVSPASEVTIQDDTAGCTMRNIRVNWIIAEHE